MAIIFTLYLLHLTLQKMQSTFLKVFVLMAGLQALPVWPQVVLVANRTAHNKDSGLGLQDSGDSTGVRLVTDRTAYDVGSEVRVRPVSVKGPERPSAAALKEMVLTVRYAGEQQPVAANVVVPVSQRLGPTSPSGYSLLWKIPAAARTGRYEVDVVEDNPQSRDVYLRESHAASFTVYRKLVHIDEIKLDKTFYTAGDTVAAVVKVSNLTDRPFAGLQVEFSDRYWPWIGPTGGSTDLHIVSLGTGLALPPHTDKQLSSARAAVADAVKQPAIHQYAVVVWDADRQRVYDIAFSPLVFFGPPGVTEPKVYPGGYPYPNLGAVDFTSYRNFCPAELDSAAIQFDCSHTMWAPGSEAVAHFTVGNPTTLPWRGVSIRARLLGPEGSELRSNVVAESLDLNPNASRVSKQTAFSLPERARGTYRVEVQVKNASGEILSSNRLEWGVNPLPRSILVFCAHEDDEMGHGGMARAAVENHVPIRYVYFTSGDAGSCDRYYQHSCSPAEALNFGALRMDEARAAVGHLGVPRDDIHFLGLPDGGSGEIWYKYLKPANPYLDPLLATDHAPYEGLELPNLPYARDSVVEAVKGIIKRVGADVIYTAHPPDPRHIDHKVNNYFVVKALQELLREGAVSPDVKVLVDEVYDPKMQAATPYHFRDYDFYVSGEVKALTQEASWFYPSQGVSRRVKTFDQLPRKEMYREVLDWKEHEGWNERN
jgi:LmbE family N-acetylglucosaminyl deacetylase